MDCSAYGNTRFSITTLFYSPRFLFVPCVPGNRFFPNFTWRGKGLAEPRAAVAAEGCSSRAEHLASRETEKRLIAGKSEVFWQRYSRCLRGGGEEPRRTGEETISCSGLGFPVPAASCPQPAPWRDRGGSGRWPDPAEPPCWRYLPVLGEHGPPHRGGRILDPSRWRFSPPTPASTNRHTSSSPSSQYDLLIGVFKAVYSVASGSPRLEHGTVVHPGHEHPGMLGSANRISAILEKERCWKCVPRTASFPEELKKKRCLELAGWLPKMATM